MGTACRWIKVGRLSPAACLGEAIGGESGWVLWAFENGSCGKNMRLRQVHAAWYWVPWTHMARSWRLNDLIFAYGLTIGILQTIGNMDPNPGFVCQSLANQIIILRHISSIFLSKLSKTFQPTTQRFSQRTSSASAKLQLVNDRGIQNAPFTGIS